MTWEKHLRTARAILLLRVVLRPVGQRLWRRLQPHPRYCRRCCDDVLQWRFWTRVVLARVGSGITTHILWANSREEAAKADWNVLAQELAHTQV